MAERVTARAPTAKPSGPAPKGRIEVTRQPQWSGPDADVMALQRFVGNRTVSRLLASTSTALPAIQTKLIVSEPGDESEREADRVAAIVTRSERPMPLGLSPGGPRIARKCAACASGASPCSTCTEE